MRAQDPCRGGACSSRKETLCRGFISCTHKRLMPNPVGEGLAPPVKRNIAQAVCFLHTQTSYAQPRRGGACSSRKESFGNVLLIAHFFSKSCARATLGNRAQSLFLPISFPQKKRAQRKPPMGLQGLPLANLRSSVCELQTLRRGQPPRTSPSRTLPAASQSSLCEL